MNKSLETMMMRTICEAVTNTRLDTEVNIINLYTHLQTTYIAYSEQCTHFAYLVAVV